MKTNATRKEVRGKDDAALAAAIAETREAIRAQRFGRRTAAPAKGAATPRALRRQVARLETERSARRLAKAA